MNYFFANPEAIVKLQAAAQSWLGTPFMPNAAVKGRGVSCQKLAGEIYRECGLIDFEIPEGPMDWSNAHTDSLVTKYLESQPNFHLLTPNSSPMPGDLLGLRIGGCINHVGVMVDTNGKFIHCLRGHGVQLSSIRDATYVQRLEKIWRPVV